MIRRTSGQRIDVSSAARMQVDGARRKSKVEYLYSCRCRRGVSWLIHHRGQRGFLEVFGARIERPRREPPCAVPW
jgi:hypothetical protein